MQTILLSTTAVVDGCRLQKHAIISHFRYLSAIYTRHDAEQAKTNAQTFLLQIPLCLKPGVNCPIPTDEIPASRCDKNQIRLDQFCVSESFSGFGQKHTECCLKGPLSVWLPDSRLFVPTVSRCVETTGNRFVKCQRCLKNYKNKKSNRTR